MYIISKRILISNSKTTGDIIPWSTVETYIKKERPDLLDESKWTPIVKNSEITSEIGFKGYWGFTVINGKAHYFVIDFFQYNSNEHSGEYVTIIALVEIDEKQNKISNIECFKANVNAATARKDSYKCNNLDVKLTTASSFQELLSGSFKVL